MIKVGGSGYGNNGNVTIIAGASEGTSITTGSISTSGDRGVAAGTDLVSMDTAQPTSSDGQPVVFGTDGSITSENFFVPSSALLGASIAAGR